MSTVTIHAPVLELPRRRRPVRQSSPVRQPTQPSFQPTTQRAAGARALADAQVAAGPLRLTRRGRLAVTLLTAVLVLVVALVGARVASGTTTGPSVPSAVASAGTGVVEQVVAPGDTLWSIALGTGTTGDVRDVVAQIRGLNALGTSQLQPGQTLLVPAT